MRNLDVQREPVDTVGFGAPLQSCRIAALQGAPCATIQTVLNDFALRAARQGHKIAGVVELAGGVAGDICGRRAVRELSTGTVISISQNLGHGSTACNLDPSGLIEACAAVERAIAAGADLVILSKFGKIEAERGGLRDAFSTAIGAGLPILTAVSPAMTPAWQLFAGPLSQFIRADANAVDTWWSGIIAGHCLPAYE
ncbi:MAG: DUF2478 domain-containing protein [Xanthobacteraceae bacterium]|jgi:hypothetical protein